MKAVENINSQETQTLVGKDPEAAMNALFNRGEESLKLAEELHVKWEIEMNAVTWRNQEECCKFINKNFPELDNLALLV